MKLSKMAFGLTAFVAATTAWAGNLVPTSYVEILALDGHRVKKDTKHFPINENQQHQIVVEVGGIVNGDYFSSEQTILTFQGSAENVKIETPAFRSDLDVRKFLSKPTLTLKTDSGKALPFKQDVLRGDGFMASSRVEDNLSKYNLGKNPASVEKFGTAPLEAKGQIIVDTNNVKIEELQTLFNKADKDTQKRFLDWAKKSVK